MPPSWRAHDATLQHGRRTAALVTVGAEAEPFLLDLAGVDAEHRLNYASLAPAARLALCCATDRRCAPRCATAFEALGRIGLDARRGARHRCLDDPDATVRAMAAALHDWSGAGNAVSKLARRLDDTWTVAVRAARSLQSTPDGRAALEARAASDDLAGELARQILWEAVHHV